MMPVANPARPARNPSAAQIRVLARMVQFGAVIRVYAWTVKLEDGVPHRASISVYGRHGAWMWPIPHRSYTSLRVAGWIEPTANTCEWRVSDAGRRAAE